MKTGNKYNAAMNKEWAKHVRSYLKKRTSEMRRAKQKRILQEEIGLMYSY